MTAVLAAAARAAVVLAALAVMIWAGTGPPGPWAVARVTVMGAAVTAAALTWDILRSRKGDEGDG